MKYIAYCRKSREEKDKQILSIQAQIAELKEYAKREHLEITEFIEEEKTAKSPGREKFAEVLKKIEKGTVGGIIAWHPDRLARNSIDGGKIIYLLDTGKLKDLKFPTSWFENTPQGKFMLNIAFGQSKYYVDNLSENVKRGLRQKIRNGVYPGKAPDGYINNPKTRGIDVESEKLKAIKKAFELFSEGNKTFTDIALFLHKFNLKRKNNKPLHINEIRRILANRFYVGIMEYNGEYHEGTHKTIISKELFQAVKKQLEFKDRHKKRRYNFAFMGLMKCGECGATITAEVHKKYYKGTNRTVEYVYYRCTKKLKACTQKYIPEPELEIQFKKAIDEVALPQEWANDWYKWLDEDEKLEAVSMHQNIERLEAELKTSDIKLNKLLDGYLEGIVDPEIYKLKKNEFFEEKLKINEELEQIKQNGSSWLEPFRNFIGSALSCAKIARAKNTSEELAFFGKTVGSNFFLTNRQLAVSYKKGFAELCAPPPAQSQSRLTFADSLSVGVLRIELRPHDPQPRILPLNYTPWLLYITKFCAKLKVNGVKIWRSSRTLRFCNCNYKQRR